MSGVEGRQTATAALRGLEMSNLMKLLLASGVVKSSPQTGDWLLSTRDPISSVAMRATQLTMLSSSALAIRIKVRP